MTGFSEDDLQYLWKTIINMFEYDHSVARGNMAVRELIVFKHDSELGNALAYKLFDTIHVQKKRWRHCSQELYGLRYHCR